MKRPPELYIISTVLFVLILHHTNGRRATELIFRKTSSTTSTEAVPDSEKHNNDETTETTEVLSSTTKSNFTGNPQLDYIYDPNLPRELNGYNLSSYPFYNGMPEDIDFKCDGLHDGFYASVPHKCQVYHHCLFGTRYDFLCANYTAFDQKTFICHFVSEVDCINSPKFWHRNDALYQTATTTTTTNTPLVINPALTASPRRPHPGVRRPKPSTRRRPQYEYYDEDYEENVKDDYYEEPLPRNRRKRPRPRRPRPVYDDDYEDYEDERYERRGQGRYKEDDHRKPHHRRQQNRENTNPRKQQHRDHLDDDKSIDYSIQDDDKSIPEDKEPESRYRNEKPQTRRPQSPKSKHAQREENHRDTDDRQPDYYDDERPNKNEDNYRHETKNGSEERRRRPIKSESRDTERPREKRPNSNRDRFNRRPSSTESTQDFPKRSNKRPHNNEEYDDEVLDSKDDYDNQYSSNSRNNHQSDSNTRRENERPHFNKNQDKIAPNKQNNNTSSIYNQPRIPPRIKPPVPKNEQSKFTHRQTTTAPSKTTEIYEDYEEYEDEEVSSSQKSQNKQNDRKPSKNHSQTNEESKHVPQPEKQHLNSQEQHVSESVYEDYDTRTNFKNSDEGYSHETSEKSNRMSTRNKSVAPERDHQRSKPKINSNRQSTFSTPKEQQSDIDLRPTERIKASNIETTVKVLKRPFLPSRGGNPYMARGLQPVGTKALGRPKAFTISNEQSKSVDESDQSSLNVGKQPIKDDVLTVDATKETFNANRGEKEYGDNTNRENTQAEVNPLNIDDEEYDVTLNDALSPTLPNLPIRNLVNSQKVSQDYTYGNIPRPRFEFVSPQENENQYNVRSSQKTIRPHISDSQRKFVVGNYESQNDQSHQRERYIHPQITQAQTHGYYSDY